MAMRIGILFFDQMEELDAFGPHEVLSWWAQRHPSDDVEVVTFSRDGAPVRCNKGIVVVPQVAEADAGPLDVLVHPGGFGCVAQMDDPAHLQWLREQRDRVPVLASVCTGSLVFATAGLLKNRPATSYWGHLERLAQIDPSTAVRDGVRFVDDGDVVTSAGISAGIDMALHLVARFAGDERARQVARGIEYDYSEYGLASAAAPAAAPAAETASPAVAQ